MASLLEEDVCDDVFWLEILPLLNLKDYMALASTSTTMRRRCLAESRPKLPIPVRDLYKLLAPVTDEEARKFRQGQDSSLSAASPNASVGLCGLKMSFYGAGHCSTDYAKDGPVRRARIEWPNGRHGVRWDTVTY